MIRPLRPMVYLVRNAGKTLPLMGVIVLAVMLIAGIVAMMNSIPLSIRTIYQSSEMYLGLTPRGDATRTPELRQKVETESPVPVDRILTARVSETQVKSIVGGWAFVVLGLTRPDQEYFLAQYGGRLEGRLPEPGQAEVVISEPIARNLDLAIGSTFMGPTMAQSYSPFEVKVVGIVQTEWWLAVASREYFEAHHFPQIDVLLAFAKDRARQEELDRWAEQAFEGERARVYAYFLLERETEAMFQTLYAILNVVIGTLVVVITIMMGMLINIYQSQRLQEFGLLQALGYTRKELVKRSLLETSLVTIGGWIVGLGAAYGLLWVTNQRLMYPSAFALDLVDRAAYSYTVPVPVAIFLIGTLTVLLRFRKFDPVGVVERRLV